MLFSRVVSQWFDARRGFALGVMAGLGNGLGTAIMPVVAMFLMRWGGWRGAYVGLGACVAVVSFPVLFAFLRERGTQDTASAAEPVVENGLSFRDATRTREFWVIMIAIASGAGSVTAIVSHFVPMLGEQGVSIERAVSLMSVLTIVCTVWQVVMGRIMDASRSSRMVVPFYVAALIGVPLLQSGNMSLVWIGGICMGIGMGTEFGALPYIVSRYFGLRRYGAIAGLCMPR